MTYHVDRFFAAVSVLAGHGHIKQRLIKAFEEHLLDISEDELPLSARQAFLDVKAQLHRVSPLNGEGPICASVRKMSAEQASECAGLIVALYTDLIQFGGGSDTAMVMSRGERNAVPPFLVKSN
jgi:hypothetical protein